MKTIEVDGLTTLSERLIGRLRIRVDPSSGDFWGLSYDSSEIVSFNSDGKKINSVKNENEWRDFSFDKFGHLYFSDRKSVV